jgi:hypothetical protein
VYSETVTHSSVGGVVETRLGNQEGAPLLLPNFLGGGEAATPPPYPTPTARTLSWMLSRPLTPSRRQTR